MTISEKKMGARPQFKAISILSVFTSGTAFGIEPCFLTAALGIAVVLCAWKGIQ